MTIAETGLVRGVRTSLLAIAERDQLLELAAACLAAGLEPIVLTPAEAGTVMLQVREPIAGERFHLGEVLVSRAEVSFRGALGWCMRLGHDPEAALAAAICDAECEAGGPQATAIETLCRDTAELRAAASAAEWQEIAPTVVSFEELD